MTRLPVRTGQKSPGIAVRATENDISQTGDPSPPDPSILLLAPNLFDRGIDHAPGTAMLGLVPMLFERR